MVQLIKATVVHTFSESLEISDQSRKDFYSFVWSVSINYSLTETFYFIYFLVNKEHDRERIVLLITLSTLLKKFGIFSTFLFK